MTNDKPLAGMRILDFSHRLPGPLAGHLLTHLGAQVTKIEDQTFKDAFAEGLFSDMDSSFIEWYHALNENKEVLRLDFKDAEAKQRISQLVASCDAVILGLPPKVQKLLGISKEELLKLDRPLAIVEMGASKSHVKAMHDLNALALTGLLALYVADKNEAVIAPPFLPMAGIAFGGKIALDLTSTYIHSLKTNRPSSITSYLFESTNELFGPFWPQSVRNSGQTKFLHNGLFPCYALYRLKDGAYVALAAVEEKFWRRFCEVFELDFSGEQRFHHTDQSVFETVSNRFLNLTRTDVESKIKNEDFCLSLIDPSCK